LNAKEKLRKENLYFFNCESSSKLRRTLVLCTGPEFKSYSDVLCGGNYIISLESSMKCW